MDTHEVLLQGVKLFSTTRHEEHSYGMGSSARSKYIVLLVQGAEATPEAAFRENTECVVERLETTTLLGLPEELDPGDLGQAVPAREPTQA